MRKIDIRAGALCLCLLVVSCQSDRDEVTSEMFEIQSEELEHARKQLRKADQRLLELEGFRVQHEQIKKVKDQLLDLEGQIKESTGSHEEAEAKLAVQQQEFSKLLRQSRMRVRRAWVGKKIDLSLTKGEGYEAVKVFEVMPNGIKIQRDVGPETVPLAEIPKAIRDLFLMSDEEAQEFADRMEQTAKRRVERYRDWKEANRNRTEDKADQAVRARTRELQKQVDEINRRYDIRRKEMDRLTAVAVAWEQRSINIKSKPGKGRAFRYALAYREKAAEIEEGNNRALRYQSGLIDEIRELQETLK